MAPQRFALHTISNADFFDALRTLRQLDELHAKGAILNKREWWVTWTTMPEVRVNWLLETEEALLKARVAFMWSQSPYRLLLLTEYDHYTRLLEIADMADESEKHAAIEAALSQVLYPPGYHEDDAFREGKHFGEEEGEGEEEWKALESLQIAEVPEVPANMANKGGDGESKRQEEDDDGPYESSAIDTNFAKVFARHKKMYAVGQITWYIVMTMVREELRLLPPAGWTRERIRELTERIWAEDNKEVVVRA